MSKAFTKEAEAEDLPEVSPPLPSGTKNYLTPEGHARLTDELNHLRRVERP
ncbi:MAG: transcription elongation factor GreB, partial [Alphaproteobacteria bacterium]|nr:transcription elongation factor GreB [Alphaproteobacteria bacterium]